ncbi:MAG: hypothetical protein M3T49_10420 [Candidatus Eremiobacteraeota bacterium]|nr:hypothetical protein [Candidatus Eremiobacteraeota bacterium]
MFGTIVHRSRFGFIVRLADGRLATLAASDADDRTLGLLEPNGRRTSREFIVESASGDRLRVSLARPAGALSEPSLPAVPPAAPESLEHKIIDYLRQTTEWDPHGAASGLTRFNRESRADRLLPFEARARRQYREDPKRSRRGRSR